jgi:dTDP-4-amino-4,6-dideoxygalactose transaminase
MKTINYSTQSIDKNDIQAVIKTLRSKYLTKGNVTIDFEKKIKNFCKSKYVCATINASSSLLMACISIGINKNDYVWTSNITYIASINCALHLGAKIKLVDINETNNICVDKLKKELFIAKKIRKLPKALVVVHLAGLPCNLQEIKKLSKIYKFKIIEDASHAFGANYNNTKIGSCKFSDLTVFSFHPVKNITTAEGGAITTNDRNLYKKLILIRENGVDFSRIDNKKFPTKYDISTLGYNFRINEINSSLGISQIRKVNKFINLKKKIAKKYFKELDIPQISLPDKNLLKTSSLHLFIIKIDFKKLKINKFQLINILKKNNINVNSHYIPLNKFSLIKKNIKQNNKFINSENYYKEAISIPMYPDLTYKKQNYFIKTLIKIINKYKK